jgi:hypothetical protein
MVDVNSIDTMTDIQKKEVKHRIAQLVFERAANKQLIRDLMAPVRLSASEKKNLTKNEQRAKLDQKRKKHRQDLLWSGDQESQSIHDAMAADGLA